MVTDACDSSSEMHVTALLNYLIRVGGPSGCTFTFTLVLRISSSQNPFFSENLAIHRLEQTFGEIPEMCDFGSKPC